MRYATNEQAIAERAAGLTTSEHEYIKPDGKLCVLTAAQVAAGVHLTPKWLAERTLAECIHRYHAARRQDPHEFMEADKALNAAHRVMGRFDAPRKSKCLACGKGFLDTELKIEDKRTRGRCALCYSHYVQRVQYTNPVQKARSKYLDTVAKKEPKKSKHCPKCHHLRHKDEFLKFSDPYGHCTICRDDEWNQQRRARAIAQAGLPRKPMGAA